MTQGLHAPAQTERGIQRVPTELRVRFAAWGLCGIYLLIAASTVGLVLSGSGDGDRSIVVFGTAYAVVGALVAIREPRNAVGWLMLGITISFAFEIFLESYFAEHGRPVRVALAWIGNWSGHWWPALSGLILPLVFPNGRLLSRRWRPVLWIALTSLALQTVSDGLRSGPLDYDSAISNPLGISGLGAPVIEALGELGDLLVPLALVLSVSSLVLRLRRSRGRERQQMKRFAYVGGLAMCGLGLTLMAGFATEISGPDGPAWIQVVGAIGWITAWPLILVGLPVAIGTAMLRHRLYDIDLVIKRTLVYGALTVLLASVYLTLVLGLRTLLNPVTGESDLAVAASTLAVAAFFRPLRTRIQTLVDRRFYRARYNASQAITAFTAQLRQEVDLDAVTTDLLNVVRATLQPEHATLWLRKPG
jgi:hypothetical protein